MAGRHRSASKGIAACTIVLMGTLLYMTVYMTATTTVRSTIQTDDTFNVVVKLDSRILLSEQKSSIVRQQQSVQHAAVPVGRRVWPNPDGEATRNPYPADINFLLHDADLCKNSPNIEWLVYFHSKPDNFDERRTLRLTWASEELFKLPVMKRVFMVGIPPSAPPLSDNGDAHEHNSDAEKFDKLVAEFAEHGDLVIGDFIDSYQNLTLKSIMALKWISMHCANEVKYVIKADDDTYVNIVELTSLMRRQTQLNRTIVCPFVREGSMPIYRDPAQCRKWCAKDSDFPGDTVYPMYCYGAAYVISAEMIGDLYGAALRTRMFYVDDIYTTGLLPLKLSYPVSYVNFKMCGGPCKQVYAEYTSNGTATYLAVVPSDFGLFLTCYSRSFYKLTADQLDLLSDVMKPTGLSGKR